MHRSLPLAAVILVSMLNPLSAADLPVQSRLGAVFAAPAPPAYRQATVSEIRTWGVESVYAPEVEIQPLVNGYYGKPNSYLYRSYYGTPPDLIFERLPYACGFYGYC